MKINFCKIKYLQSLISNAEETYKRWEANQDGAVYTINNSIEERQIFQAAE